jgi:chemotaxis protein CheX
MRMMKIEMKTENLNPFIQSVSDVFERTIGCKIERSIRDEIGDNRHNPDIIGFIGISGTAKGIIALRFPVETALKIVDRMAGRDCESVDISIIEKIGKLTNIVADNGICKFTSHSISLSLPIVIRGSICRPTDIENAIVLSVPFESELGGFSIIIAFQSNSVTEREDIAPGVISR